MLGISAPCSDTVLTGVRYAIHAQNVQNVQSNKYCSTFIEMLIVSQACLRALPHTQPGQKVSCMPGIVALSDKRRLIETLTSAYGEGAFSILPRTFLLPELYWEWRLWIQGQVQHRLYDV